MAMAVAALLVPLSTWFVAVNQTVTEPYLDEVFHIRQAQHYCAGHFEVWDPKITTPPGLYVLSLLPIRLSGFFEEHFATLGLDKSWLLTGCDLFGLRSVSAIGLIFLLLVVRRTYQQRSHPRQGLRAILVEHSALNIALFPPLFFFSALYYTDIWSTALVVLYYSLLSGGYGEGSNGGLRLAKLLFIGLASLTFRQTNIFWVGIFPAALVLVQQIDRGSPAVRSSMTRRVEGFADTFYNVAKNSWRFQVLYDPSVRDAWLDDYLKNILSIVVCTVKLATQPKRLIGLATALSPYITLLGLFATFIFWNGSVVLGDKSNHVATLHVPQMLYLWPFVAFFSWPLIVQYTLLVPFFLLACIPAFAGLESFQFLKRKGMIPHLFITLGFLGIACAVVYGNTIVHPFTLADNRHYVFYVFRKLLNPWWVRYAATPIYLLCAWACIQSLGSGPSPDPLAERRQADGTASRLPLPDSRHSATTSFLLIWLATSALQLITAPLVEPRYFILPWIFWRMHLPLQIPASPRRRREAKWSWKAAWEVYDHRLVVETLWLLVINAGTGYVFLKWGFEWPQEPGLVQRFMW